MLAPPGEVVPGVARVLRLRVSQAEQYPAVGVFDVEVDSDAVQHRVAAAVPHRGSRGRLAARGVSAVCWRRPGRLLRQAPPPRGERPDLDRSVRPAAVVSPALPGRSNDLTAARTHRIIRICERQGVPILADLAYQGGGPWVTTGIKRRPHHDLTPTAQTLNRALACTRAPVERGVARLKCWRIFRHARCSPNRMTSIAKAVLTLERHR